MLGIIPYFPTGLLLQTLALLTDDLKIEVLHYAEYLASKSPVANSQQNEENSPPKRCAGLLEGKIWMSDDFDEPLADFAEYM